MIEDSRIESFNKQIYILRGAIINNLILLERTIDEYLSVFFTKNKELCGPLRDWVFAECINLDNKIKILSSVLENYENEFLSHHSSLIANLQYLKDKRNVFAHYLILNDEESVELFLRELTVTFVKFRTDSYLIFYKKDELERIERLMASCTPILVELVEKGRAKPSQLQ